VIHIADYPNPYMLRPRTILYSNT